LFDTTGSTRQVESVRDFVCGAEHEESVCPAKPKPEKPSAEILAPIPAEILDQIVRDGPLTAADVETATRRFKKR